MKSLLVLNIAPQLEDALIDYLISVELAGGFTSYEVRGHGDHQGLSISEQVSGRRRRIQVELMLETENIEPVLRDMKQEVGADIVYWHHPIEAMGRLL